MSRRSWCGGGGRSATASLKTRSWPLSRRFGVVIFDLTRPFVQSREDAISQKKVGYAAKTLLPLICRSLFTINLSVGSPSYSSLCHQAADMPLVQSTPGQQRRRQKRKPGTRPGLRSIFKTLHLKAL